MTDQQPRTPSTEDIELLVLAQLKQTAERHGFPHDIEADRADFRRWYNGEIAAAEQRKAVKAWRDGYVNGVQDERHREQIGAVEEPNRANPYHTDRTTDQESDDETR